MDATKNYLLERADFDSAGNEKGRGTVSEIQKNNLEICSGSEGAEHHG